MKFKLYLILIVLVTLASIPTILAQPITFDLEYSGPLVSYSGATSQYGAQSVYPFNSLRVNFTRLTSPQAFVFESSDFVNKEGATGTVIGTIGTNLIFVADYQIQNGTYSGGYTLQYYLSFRYFDKHQYSGLQDVSLAYSPDLPAYLPNTYTTFAYDPSTDIVPMFFDRESNMCVKGYFVTVDHPYAKNTFTIERDSNTSITNIGVDKGTSSSIIRAFSQGNLVYTQAGGSTNNNLNFTLLSDPPLIFQAIFFGNTYVNSSEYFKDTYALTVNPSSGELTQPYIATITSSSGGNINAIPSLIQYSLFENYGSTQYNLAKTPSGIPITYAKSGNNWTQYSGNSSLGWIDIGTILPLYNDFVLCNDSVLGTTGTRSFTAELVFGNGQESQHLYDFITITTPGNIPTSNTVNFTVIDSSTSAAIAGSNLSVLQTRSASGPVSGAPWWNQTSLTGKFSVSGLGISGLQSLLFGDEIYIEGSAEGYVSNSLNLYIGSETIGSTQYIPLTPNEYAPGIGYFTAIYSAYDTSNSNALSGVSVKQYCSGLTNVGVTNAAGIYSTYNNTAGTCSYTASKSGYTTITKSFTGTSQQILNIDVPMSSTGVNPTATTTRTSTISTGPTTIVPTTTGGNYTGFWAPYYQMFHAMGAQDTELGVLMTACLIIFLLVIIGIISGGNLYAINSAAALGFILSCAFGWIYFWLILAGVLWLLIPLVFRRVE